MDAVVDGLQYMVIGFAVDLGRGIASTTGPIEGWMAVLAVAVVAVTGSVIWRRDKQRGC